MKKLILAALVLVAFHAPTAPAQSSDIPHLEKRDGRFALIVDGKPFLVLGGQIGNSSAWPATLPGVWSAAEAMHANTVEAPVYWEQIEPAKGTFDFSNMDLLVTQARQHHLHLVLLWFGTWKNGQNHYVPEWIKSDPKTYPREENAYGKLLDVMSPNSPANLDADKTAFAALLGHIKSIDAAQHTVIMIQVENESGSVGSIRDFSPAAQKQFDATVPADFARAMHLPTGGTWSKTFGPDADESFAAYSTAHYIGEVAAAGKAEYPLPMYCNVWFAYPVHALENRDRPSAGQEYPSGGPQQANIPIWKAAAPAIDILAPDFYSDDFSL
ncbi:MAG: beta-galactosidase, partial [Terracidiphilus sp.]